jgi:DNA-binding transcriptional regulator YdaS (Cro superfamily)
MSTKKPKYEEFEEDVLGDDDPSAETYADLIGVSASSLGSAVVWGSSFRGQERRKVVGRAVRTGSEIEPNKLRQLIWEYAKQFSTLPRESFAISTAFPKGARPSSIPL